MAITDELQAIRDELEQLRAAGDVRRRLSRIYSDIGNLDKKVDDYKANTGFDDIPAETKAALNRFYQFTLQLKSAFEADADFDVVIRRRPPVT